MAFAHGPAVDAIDESCRDLMNAYKCIEIDELENGNPKCDAQAVDYTPYDFHVISADLEDGCTRGNVGNECAIKACIVEGAFTFNFISFISSGELVSESDDFDSDFVHENKGGSFDPAVHCPSGAGHGESQTTMGCCGEFNLLTRKPFREDHFQCCAGGLVDASEVCV